MEQSGTSALLQGVVQDLASGVALRDGQGDGVVLAAVRVLGADLLLPSALFGAPPTPGELSAVRAAVENFPPRPGAAPNVAWSHWGLTRALRRVDPGFPEPPYGVPDTAWLRDDSWQSLTRRLAALAALAVPGEDSAVTDGAQQRVVDVSRGFVRAVRRRDWRQAAGAGRWLALLRDVPETLGLDAGLDFVELMGGGDACVALQVQAARLMRSGVAA